MSEKNQNDSWVICPECKTKLKQENLAAHMKHIHNKIIDDVQMKSMETFHKKRQEKKPKDVSSKIAVVAIILLVIAVVVAAVILIFSASNEDNGANSNGQSWMNNYTPANSVGNGADNFWINFPVGSAYPDQIPQHLTWITEDLKEKPVVFVCHRTGCGPCTPQADRVKALRETYGEDAVFYDLDYPFEGYGTATQDILDKFYEAFYYDPNGGSQVIAFTGVFTLIKDGGEVKIGWHSWEGNVADADMENWIKDAIYHYHTNSED
jgi:hypothetical protein